MLDHRRTSQPGANPSLGCRHPSYVPVGGFMAKCEHLKQASSKIQPRGDVCQACVEAGQRWTELRQCLVCGYVGCCDSSPGRHATQHFKDTGHPVIQAFKSGDWKWCYVHESYL